jgi:hypothetical protein
VAALGVAQGLLAKTQASSYCSPVNAKHHKTLAALFTNPVNGALAWSRIEALLVAIGCEVHEGKGSAVLFSKNGYALRVHRPHPSKEALRYRVIEARSFLEDLGVTP